MTKEIDATVGTGTTMAEQVAAKQAAKKAEKEAKAAEKAAKARAAKEKKEAKAKLLADKKAEKEAKKAAKEANKKPKVVLSTANGITMPGDGTTTKSVWLKATEMSEKLGKPAARKDVVAACIADGTNPATASTQYGKWRKYYGIKPEVKEPKAKKVAEKAAEA